MSRFNSNSKNIYKAPLCLQKLESVWDLPRENDGSYAFQIHAPTEEDNKFVKAAKQKTGNSVGFYIFQDQKYGTYVNIDKFVFFKYSVAAYKQNVHYAEEKLQEFFDVLKPEDINVVYRLKTSCLVENDAQNGSIALIGDKNTLEHEVALEDLHTTSICCVVMSIADLISLKHVGNYLEKAEKYDAILVNMNAIPKVAALDISQREFQPVIGYHLSLFVDYVEAHSTDSLRYREMYVLVCVEKAEEKGVVTYKLNAQGGTRHLQEGTFECAQRKLLEEAGVFFEDEFHKKVAEISSPEKNHTLFIVHCDRPSGC